MTDFEKKLSKYFFSEKISKLKIVQKLDNRKGQNTVSWYVGENLEVDFIEQLLTYKIYMLQGINTA